MDPLEGLKALTSQMHLEPAEDASCPQLDKPMPVPGMVHQAAMPGGKPFALLKTLLSSACERDCYYCPFRAGRNFRRTTLKPDEMAQAFIKLHSTGIVEGLFLSSGIIKGGITSQDKLIDTAEILRYKLGYRGYLHLKIMPGAERDQVLRTMQLSDRVSINLEAPNDTHLAHLAPQKLFFEELLQPLRWVEEIRQTITPQTTWNGRWPSSITQFVVGPAGESDLELLNTTEHLYRDLRLRRAYFSAFRPIEDTPLENIPPTTTNRESRLYQASFLIRDYGFTIEELTFDKDGNLLAHVDPKLAWAQKHLVQQPVEINRASLAQLLRIPGIGPRGARAIMQSRHYGRLHEAGDLKKIGVDPTRAGPFILVQGKRPAHQLGLF